MPTRYPDEWVHVEPIRSDPLAPPMGYRALKSRPEEHHDGLFDFEIFDPFLYFSSGVMPWEVRKNGTATQCVPDSSMVTTTDKALGVMSIDSGTDTNSYTGLFLGGNNHVLLGNADIRMDWRIKLPVLASDSEPYALTVGFFDLDTVTAPDATDGAYFLYDYINHGIVWKCVTAKASSRQISNSLVNVTTSPILLTIHFTPDWARPTQGWLAIYYINGVQVAVNSTDMPTADGNMTVPSIRILNRGTVTSSKKCLIDTFRMQVRHVR